MNKVNTLIFSCILLSATGWAQNRTNPVIKGVADAGVLRYAGKYYLGGVATYGDFYVSDDLTHWDRRIHVFDLDNEWTHGTRARNNQVHADDITYSNGLFHLLFSVNYWGADRHIVHITHATSPNITGPFQEVRKDQWFENRIDPHVFRDDNGALYLYMVKFTDGNTIWCRAINQDFSFAGDAVQQFSSQPGTWETMDNRVAEGPFVIKYRGRYYMMYNANHTSHHYGNYRLGVCEADSPMGFNPGGKYSHPVVGPSTDRSLLTIGTPMPPDSLFTPGQPNLVRGPNGFEWWLVYMANKGAVRDQYVDRIHFINNRLTVDGITDRATAGFHPLPAMPQYRGTSLDSIVVSDAFLLELTFSGRSGIALGDCLLTLPENFDPEVAHVWRIEKNFDLMTVWIDDILIMERQKVNIPAGITPHWTEPGVRAAYVGYTNGWDEYDGGMSGWKDGWKGDARDSYELSVMFDNDMPGQGKYGVYAAWYDARNYVRVTIDAQRQLLVVDNCKKGKTQSQEIPLTETVVHYPDVKYTDTYEKQYRFDSDTYVSAVTMPYATASTQIASWLDGDTWRLLTCDTVATDSSKLQTLRFPQVKTRALRFINRDPRQNIPGIYQVETTRDFAAQYQLRVDKRGNNLRIFVDNREMAHISSKKASSARIGLFAPEHVRIVNTLYFEL